MSFLRFERHGKESDVTFRVTELSEANKSSHNSHLRFFSSMGPHPLTDRRPYCSVLTYATLHRPYFEADTVHAGRAALTVCEPSHPCQARGRPRINPSFHRRVCATQGLPPVQILCQSASYSTLSKMGASAASLLASLKAQSLSEEAQEAVLAHVEAAYVIRSPRVGLYSETHRRAPTQIARPWYNRSKTADFAMRALPDAIRHAVSAPDFVERLLAAARAKTKGTGAQLSGLCGSVFANFLFFALLPQRSARESWLWPTTMPVRRCARPNTACRPCVWFGAPATSFGADSVGTLCDGGILRFCCGTWQCSPPQGS